MRLIDADVLVRDFLKDRDDFDVCVVYDIDIREAPTIDAVPVVRCGECKEYEDGDCYHPLAYGMGSMLRGLEPTDFCSYGERKENG